MKISLRHLTYFNALCATGHFGHAAEQVNVSQPALSVKIKELEDILGAPLIDRTVRPFQPTPYGHEILTRAQRIISEIQNLEDSALRERGTEGPFTLGVIPTVAPYLLPGALKLVQERLPKLDLRLREATTETITAEMESGALDACVLATDVDALTFKQRMLFQDRFVLALHAKEARELGLEDGKIELSDMKPLKLLLLSEGHCLREQTRDLCRFASEEVLNQIGASSLHTLAGLAASGYGATLLPEIALDESLLNGPLAILRLAAPEPDRTISLVSKAHLDHAMDLGPIAEILAEAGELKTQESRKLLQSKP